MLLKNWVPCKLTAQYRANWHSAALCKLAPRKLAQCSTVQTGTVQYRENWNSAVPWKLAQCSICVNESFFALSSFFLWYWWKSYKCSKKNQPQRHFVQNRLRLAHPRIELTTQRGDSVDQRLAFQCSNWKYSLNVLYYLLWLVYPITNACWRYIQVPVANKLLYRFLCTGTFCWTRLHSWHNECSG